MARVNLYWLPLGAGGHSVRLNGKVFEAVAARLAHRTTQDLYHSALVIAFRTGGSSSNKRRRRATAPSAASWAKGRSAPASRGGCGCSATRSGVGKTASSRTLTTPSTVRGGLVMTRRWPAASSSRLVACRRLSGDVTSSRQARCGTRTRSSLGRFFVPVSMPKKFVRPLADGRQAGTPAWSPLAETLRRSGGRHEDPRRSSAWTQSVPPVANPHPRFG